MRVPAADEPEVCAVQRDNLKDYWPKVRGWIEASLLHSLQHELRPDEVLARCLNGEYLMLVYAVQRFRLVGVQILTKNTDPAGKPYIAVVCAGGVEIEKWARLGVVTCRQIARDAGADKLIMMGRPGWRPMLAAFGGRLHAVVMSMDVWPLEPHEKREG